MTNQPSTLCTCGSWKDDPVHPADHEFQPLRPFTRTMQLRKLAILDVYSDGWDDGYEQAVKELTTYDADGGPGIFTVDSDN